LQHRRFPPPWSVEELEGCFVVKDRAGQKLADIAKMMAKAGRRTQAA